MISKLEDDKNKEGNINLKRSEKKSVGEIKKGKTWLKSNKYL